ncbi:hypothetical protein T03_3207 [Trichinella britovi]|uniref:Uncharacterized protein n=2 Tax=Trichinella TaxID=6333 RepID=A0A0V1DAJ4_TRIBR|nr:hypothetical protein T05_1235 [Trichinella murrelli]KRY58463.1 hypothetical protein T03_3207 [Trichinella britovi]KRZ92792.1 hypothetical protein T08_4259 [Trichinella sp. T8]
MYHAIVLRQEKFLQLFVIMLGFQLFQLFYLTPNWRSAFEMGPVVHNDSREMKTASKQSQPLDGIK